MYSTLGDQRNFIDATQGADIFVNALAAAMSSLTFDDGSEDFYVSASSYNKLVDRFNRLSKRSAFFERESTQLQREINRLQFLLIEACRR